MTLYIDDASAKRAKRIATNFLQQHHSVLDTRASFENKSWLVEARTSLFNKSVKKLTIDAKTEKIISVE